MVLCLGKVCLPYLKVTQSFSTHDSDRLTEAQRNYCASGHASSSTFSGDTSGGTYALSWPR